MAGRFGRGRLAVLRLHLGSPAVTTDEFHQSGGSEVRCPSRSRLDRLKPRLHASSL